MDTISIIAAVKAHFGPAAVRAAVMRQGYVGDGSLDDAGCVELACLDLLAQIKSTPTFQPPAFPSLETLRDKYPGDDKHSLHAAAAEYVAALDYYRQALADWEAATPENVALIFDASSWHIAAITRDPKGGWRVTDFSKLDRMPIGHREYRTRLDALDEASGPRLEKMPFEVEPLDRALAILSELKHGIPRR